MYARISLGFCIALAVLAGGFQLAADENDERCCTFGVIKVEVKPTQTNGDAWDVNNGLPDLRVIVRNMTDKKAKAMQTEERADTLKAEFIEPLRTDPLYLFAKDQVLEFEVVDVDVAINDSIGKIQVTISDKMLESGQVKLSNFGQVVSLEVNFRQGTRAELALASHEGIVVKAGGLKLVMTDKSGKNEHSHDVPIKTRVTCDGKDCRLEDLKAGAWVRVTARNATKEAVYIEAKNAK